MTTSITIRDVPEETHAELRSRAALHGQSLQEYLRCQLIDLAGRQDARTWLARVQARKQSAPSSLSSQQIIELRDRGRE